MSLSSNRVLAILKSSLVCGFKNIKDEPYAGASGHHDPDTAAVHTTNGAGPHNVQIFLLNADGVVLHCLPGYWAPDDLVHEMKFALSLNRPSSDFAFRPGDFRPPGNLGSVRGLKSTAQVVHERMAQRPFVSSPTRTSTSRSSATTASGATIRRSSSARRC